MKENLLQIKSYSFALKIVKLYKYFFEEKKEYVLNKQILRSGISIAANNKETIGRQSSKDFFAKLTKVYKEARETHFWIRLLTDTNYISKEKNQSLLYENDELLGILVLSKIH